MIVSVAIYLHDKIFPEISSAQFNDYAGGFEAWTSYEFELRESLWAVLVSVGWILRPNFSENQYKWHQ